MRIITYTVSIEISEHADFEAVTSTFEEYLQDYVEATNTEYSELVNVKINHDGGVS
jgi:hypothetical protein